MHLFRTAILALWLMPYPAMAQDFNAGMKAAQEGDFATAVQQLRPLAEQGHPLAQRYLGAMYANGDGVPHDFAEAARLYRLSAEQGVAQDLVEAIRFYTLAADQGARQAQYNLGLAYIQGQGTPKDAKAALMWFRKSAIQDFAPAQHSLGVMFATGDGVPKDLIMAQKWFILAGKTGYPPAVSERDHYAPRLWERKC